MAYYIKKIASFTVTLFLISIITFLAFQVLPGNPAEAILGVDADPVQLHNLEIELQLDKSPQERYISWIKGILKGDLGTSWKYHQKVSSIVKPAFRTTLTLSVFSLVLTVILGFTLGVISAIQKNGPASIALTFFNEIWISTPAFCTAILLIAVFSVKLKLFNSMGFVPLEQGFFKCLKSVFLPALSIALGSGAVLQRFLKNNILEELKKEYIRTARAKGLSAKEIIFGHLLRNSLIPSLTMLGLLVCEILGGSIIIENVFSIPGIGRLIATSISSRDFPLLEALVLYLASVTVICNFAVDILYSIIDPRIRGSR